MKYTPKQYALALHQAIFDSRPYDQEKILDNFVAVLKENGDVARIYEIEKEFFRYERELKGLRIAEVTSVEELSNQEEKKIIEELNSYVGSQVELRKKVDENLVGGVVIRIGEELLDGSVKKSLRDLKNELIK